MSDLTTAEIIAEHRECGKPKYDGCYSHWPTPHCRADGMALPCDVMRIATPDPLSAEGVIGRGMDMRHMAPAEPEAPDPEMLRKMLPGIDALLVIDAADAGRVISGRPDVWVVLSAFLRAALKEPT